MFCELWSQNMSRAETGYPFCPFCKYYIRIVYSSLPNFVEWFIANNFKTNGRTVTPIRSLSAKKLTPVFTKIVIWEQKPHVATTLGCLDI